MPATRSASRPSIEMSTPSGRSTSGLFAWKNGVSLVPRREEVVRVRGRVRIVTLDAVPDILREDDFVERVRIARVDLFGMVQISPKVDAVDTPREGSRAVTAPTAGRGPTQPGEAVTRSGAGVIVARLAVIGIERFGMLRTFVQVPDRAAVTVGAVGCAL